MSYASCTMFMNDKLPHGRRCSDTVGGHEASLLRQAARWTAEGPTTIVLDIAMTNHQHQALISLLKLIDQCYVVVYWFQTRRYSQMKQLPLHLELASWHVRSLQLVTNSCSICNAAQNLKPMMTVAQPHVSNTVRPHHNE
jgi:hypothetical protein